MRKLLAIGLIIAASGAASMAEPVTVIAFGDSLTHGYGLRTADGFVPQLQKWLDANAELEIIVVNAGVSGDTTAGGRSRIGWALSDGADAVIVELGGNDLLRGFDPAVSRANLDAILAEITTRDLPVLLVGLPAPGNFGVDYKTQFDAIFPELAARYDAVLYPNFFQALGNANDLVAMAALFQDDRLHPNSKGVSRIVAGIGPLVLELVARAR